MTEAMPPATVPGTDRWYTGVTRYQWLVLAIASAGWIFDVFEGQLFVIYKTPAMAELLAVDKATEAGRTAISAWSDYALASFLIGGALGGLVFGVLADRIGRQKAMVWSIAVYTVFTALHYWVTDVWQIVTLRFLVAMGVGGEWAIAASLVSEVFPKRARAAAGGIFHASSVLGAVFASLCGMLLDESDWRMAFLIGLAPALLIVWIRVSLRESEKWQESQTAGPNAEPAPASGSVLELLITPRTRNRALIGLCLASIGLGTYWGIYAWGPELARQVLIEDVEYLSGDALDRRIVEVMDPYLDEEVMATQAEATGLSAAGISVVGAAARLQEQSSPDTAQIRLLKDNQETLTAAAQAFVAGASRETLEPQLRKLASGPLGSGYRAAKGSSAYLFMNFTGGLLGLLCFAPLASCTGRRRAFAVYHVGALILAPATFLLADNYEVCVILLSVMAFFVVGMHAGYAIYFPELFPTRLRATGTSFCFNVARLISAVVIVARVPIRQELGLREAVAVMALLFSVGLVILWFAPETRDVELED